MSTRARLALLALAAVTAVGAFEARRLSVDSGVAEYLPDDVPEVKAWLDSLRRFDGFDAWLVGLEEPGAGLSLEGLRHVDAVTRKLEGLKAGGVLAVRSVTNVDSLREGEDGSVNSERLVTALPTDAASVDALRKRVLGDREVLGALVSRDLKGYAVVLRADPRKDPAQVARLIEATVEAERGPLRAHYFGAPFFAAVPVEHLVASLPWLAPVFLLLLVGILLLGTRRPGRVVAVLGGAGLLLVWWLGLLGAAGRSLSASSGNVALVLFALAGAILSSWLLGQSPSTRGRASQLVGLGALIVACLRVAALPVRYAASFGASMSLGLVALASFAAVALVGWAGEASAAPRPGTAALARVALCLAVVAAGGWLLANAHLACTPQDMFSAHDEVGESLAFFDGRFGGSDFIQVDFKGDLKDPAVAARLSRLTDLLEGSPELADVRSVAQILTFLNHGFGDAQRIPSSREALANLWFFLEGNGDVRNLVTDKHDEAMIMVRVPSHPAKGIDALVAVVGAAIERSKDLGAAAAAARLEALARSSGLALDAARATRVAEAAAHAPSAAENVAISSQVGSRLRAILASPDSPYQPSEAEWEAIAGALAGGPADLRSRLTAAVASMDKLQAAGLDAKLVDMLLERDRDLTLRVRSQLLAATLWDGSVPEALRLRSEGALADLLDPQPGAGNAAVTIGGLPVVAAAISSSLRSGLWAALAWILALGGLLSLLRGPRVAIRGLLVAATATALTVIGGRVVGVAMDSGSATLYLLPALLGFVASEAGRESRVFAIALGTAALALLFTGAAPVTRVAATAALASFSVAWVAWYLGGSSQRRLV